MTGPIKAVAKSDVGRKRANNEDAFGTFPEAGVFCVADGMGGGDDGEIASAAVVREVGRTLAEAPQGLSATVAAVREAANAASDWIFRRAEREHLSSCGSTLVALCLDSANPRAAVALHAGDSRLYRIRGKRIEQITRDHSPAGLAGATDESAVNPMFRGVILRAVGLQSSVELEETPLALAPGDRLILCSDGLSRLVPDARIRDIARSHRCADEAVESLVAAANDAGGDDNVTVVVVDIPRLRRWLPLAALGLGLAVACAVAAATFRTEPQSQPLSSPSQVEAAPVDPLRARNETEAASRLAEQCAIEKGGRYLEEAFRKGHLEMPSGLRAHIDRMAEPDIPDDARQKLAAVVASEMQSALPNLAARSDDAGFRAKVAELGRGDPSQPRTQRLAANLLLHVSTRGP